MSMQVHGQLAPFSVPNLNSADLTFSLSWGHFTCNCSNWARSDFIVSLKFRKFCFTLSRNQNPHLQLSKIRAWGDPCAGEFRFSPRLSGVKVIHSCSEPRFLQIRGERVGKIPFLQVVWELEEDHQRKILISESAARKHKGWTFKIRTDCRETAKNKTNLSRFYSWILFIND